LVHQFASLPVEDKARKAANLEGVLSVLHRKQHLVNKSKGIVILRTDLITRRNGLLFDWERIRKVAVIMFGEI
jgi:hypothetical protein